MITYIVLGFLALMLLGMPVAFAIGIASFLYFVFSDMLPASIGVQRIASATQSFPLLAVPFFVLAGNLMNATGITSRLIGFSSVLAGWIAGGLAQVSIVLSTLMGGVSGAAIADAAMEARILGPSMLQKGYGNGYASAVIAMSSLITATIPPSIGLILYGYLGNVSIGRLFLAGVIPGLLMMTAMMLTAWMIAKRRNYSPECAARPHWREVVKSAAEAKWALIFPVLLVGGIRMGIFTPSEAGSFAVVYALFIGVVVYRELTLKSALEVLHRSVADIGMIVLIIAFSATLGYAIVFERLPQDLAALVTAASSDPTVILLMILAFLVACGMFVESTVLVLLLTPIFVPMMGTLGIDPVHFGILMMTLVTFGSMTPPVGVAMYTVCGIMKCPVDEYVRASLPFVAAVIGLVLVLTFFPSVVLFLPDLLM